MDHDRFIAIINKFGEENILGIGFDNSASVTFGANDPFSLAEYYDEELHALKFKHMDLKGNPFYSIKIVEDIQCIMIKDERFYIGAYDRVDIRN